MTMGEKIYLKGERFGIYGSGTVIRAVRDDGEVKKGEYYTIDEVVQTEMGSCARNLEIVLREVNGTYTKKTFRVTQECLRRTREQTNK